MQTSRGKQDRNSIFTRLNTLERLFYAAWIWNDGIYKKFDKAQAEWAKRGRLYKLLHPEPHPQRFMFMDYPAGGDTPRVEKLINLSKQEIEKKGANNADQ